MCKYAFLRSAVAFNRIVLTSASRYARSIADVDHRKYCVDASMNV